MTEDILAIRTSSRLQKEGSKESEEHVKKLVEGVMESAWELLHFAKASNLIKWNSAWGKLGDDGLQEEDRRRRIHEGARQLKLMVERGILS